MPFFICAEIQPLAIGSLLPLTLPGFRNSTLFPARISLKLNICVVGAGYGVEGTLPDPRSAQQLSSSAGSPKLLHVL